MRFAERLKYHRKHQGLSQEALAEVLGITRQAVAKWESGQGIPDLDNALALSRLLRCSLDSLFAETEPCQVHKTLPFSPDQRELVDFLLRASRETYAGKGKEAEPSRPCSHDLRYREEPWFYLDTYVGSQRFAGEEAVWRDGKPCWAMNYCGRTLGEGFSGDFLKEALLQRCEVYPFRGPALYVNGSDVYHQWTTGDFQWFHGREEIFRDGEMVYECLFHGGMVADHLTL